MKYLKLTIMATQIKMPVNTGEQPTGHTQTAHLSFGDKYQNIGDLSAKNSHIKTKTI